MRTHSICRVAFAIAAALLPVSVSGAAIAVTGGGAVYDLPVACGSASIASLPGTDGQVSLAEAICAANGTAGADTITLDVNVTLTAPSPDAAIVAFGGAGLPSVSSDVTLVAGAGNTISRSGVAGTPPFRLFNVVAAGSLTLQGVTVSNGRIAPTVLPGFANVLQGAGIHVAAGATLRLIAGAVVRDNFLEAPSTIQTESNVAEGGGIWNGGTLIVDSSTVSGNAAFGGKNMIFHTAGEARGGGVFSSGSLTLTNATFADNKAAGGGGAVFEENFSSRGGFGKGGAVYSAATGTATITGGSFTGNRAEAGITQGGVAGNGGGGALYNAGNVPSITGARFADNIAQGAFAAVAGNTYGGAVHNALNATIGLISGATFEDNHVFGPTTFNLVGGDLFELEIEIEQSDCPQESIDAGACEALKLITETTIPALFSNAGGNNRGGALYTEGLVTQISGGTVFRMNEALGAGALFHSGGSGFGGAVAVGDGGRIATIQQTTFEDNAANGGNAGDSGGDGRGGAIWVKAGGTIGTISQSTFTGNVADGANGYPNPIKFKVKNIKDIRKLVSNGGTGKGGAIFVDDPFTLFAGGPIQVNPAPAARIDAIVDSTFDQNTAYGGGGVSGENGEGGAIYSEGELPSIAGGSFTGNSAIGEFGLNTSSAFGGAIYLSEDSGGTVITGSRIDGNSAYGGGGVAGEARARGGGIFTEHTHLTLNGVTVAGNFAEGGDSGAGDNSADGGGIHSEVANLTINDSVIEGNLARGGGSVQGGNATGGGIAMLGDNLAIARTRISGNRTKGGGGIAGGLASGGGLSIRTRILFPGAQTATIADSVFRDNVATGGDGVSRCSAGGGALLLDPAIVTTIRGTTFSGNLATGGGGSACDGEGGAIYTRSTDLSIVNSTLHGNRSKGSDGIDGGDGQGGAIHSDGVTKIYNSTITGNHVEKGSGISGFEDGGGIFVAGGVTGMFSSILHGNTRGASASTHNCYGTIESLDFNLLGPIADCTVAGLTANNRSGDPLLQALANNGGPNAPDVSAFTRALGAGSDAIDRGSCSVNVSAGGTTFANTVATDQRGGARAAPCDIGAFEAGAVVVVLTDPVLSASPAPGALAITGSGATISRAVTVTNVGGAGTLLGVTLVSVSPGYTLSSGLPIAGLASGGGSTFTVSCAPGVTAPGTLVVATNEPGAPQYTWNLTCASAALTAPVFSSSPAPGATFAFRTSGDTQTLRVTNVGPPGTLLDVTQISFNPGYTVLGGLPITGLAAGASVDIVIRLDNLENAPPSLFVVRTNEPGSPTYAYSLIATFITPTLSEWMLVALALLLGTSGLIRMRAGSPAGRGRRRRA